MVSHFGYRMNLYVKKTNIQEEEIYLKTYLYCELKDGDIVFILGNTSTPVEFDIYII